MKNKNDFNFTPYDKEVDKALTDLYGFDYYSPYQKNLNIVMDYIEKLEKTIYGYTE